MYGLGKYYSYIYLIGERAERSLTLFIIISEHWDLANHWKNLVEIYRIYGDIFKLYIYIFFIRKSFGIWAFARKFLLIYL